MEPNQIHAKEVEEIEQNDNTIYYNANKRILIDKLIDECYPSFAEDSASQPNHSIFTIDSKGGNGLKLNDFVLISKLNINTTTMTISKVASNVGSIIGAMKIAINGTEVITVNDVEQYLAFNTLINNKNNRSLQGELFNPFVNGAGKVSEFVNYSGLTAANPSGEVSLMVKMESFSRLFNKMNITQIDSLRFEITWKFPKINSQSGIDDTTVIDAGMFELTATADASAFNIILTPSIYYVPYVLSNEFIEKKMVNGMMPPIPLTFKQCIVEGLNTNDSTSCASNSSIGSTNGCVVGLYLWKPSEHQFVTGLTGNESIYHSGATIQVKIGGKDYPTTITTPERRELYNFETLSNMYGLNDMSLSANSLTMKTAKQLGYFVNLVDGQFAFSDSLSGYKDITINIRGPAPKEADVVFGCFRIETETLMVAKDKCARVL